MSTGPSATKFIFVTGGVVSSLGKGIAAASLGRLLVERGLTRDDAEVRSVHQRRPRDDVAVPARRGLRHRRRRRDRPGPRALRALHRPLALAAEQHHDRPHLPDGHQQGAPRRVPRLDGAGHPAHHRRDQERHPPHRPRPRRGHHRDRRHRRRHRVAAVPRGDPPVPPGSRPRQRALHAPHAGAVHRRRGRAQDQADPALRARADADRDPARHPRLPHRAPALRRHQAQDRALLQRGLRLRGREPRRQVHLRDPAPAPRPGARPRGLRAAPSRHQGPRPPPLAHHRGPRAAPDPRDADRRGRQVHRPARRVQVGPGGAHPRRHRPRLSRPDRVAVERPVHRPGGGRRRCWRDTTGCWYPAGSACGGSRG